MNIGFQTISFGRRLEHGGQKMLEVIKKAGYMGVEIAQHPNEFSSAEQLYRHLKGLKLKLIGLAGGSLSERSRFLGQLIDAENRGLASEKGRIKKVVRFDLAHPYIYVDTWDDVQCAGLIAQGYTLAFHPHMFKPVQTAQEAQRLLSHHPNLQFLPDSAHLTVAGEDVLEVIDENLDRIIAIHLKDWTSEFGRSYQFYSKGFGIEFGEGDVPLKGIVELLKRRKYNKWLIVEQDVADNPEEAANLCRNWLRTSCRI